MMNNRNLFADPSEPWRPVIWLRHAKGRRKDSCFCNRELISLLLKSFDCNPRNATPSRTASKMDILAASAFQGFFRRDGGSLEASSGNNTASAEAMSYRVR